MGSGNEQLLSLMYLTKPSGSKLERTGSGCSCSGVASCSCDTKPTRWRKKKQHTCVSVDVGWLEAVAVLACACGYAKAHAHTYTKKKPTHPPPINTLTRETRGYTDQASCAHELSQDVLHVHVVVLCNCCLLCRSDERRQRKKGNEQRANIAAKRC